MEEYDLFIDVSPAYNGIGPVLRETMWRAIYIILFFIVAELFILFGRSQLDPYPQFQALFEVSHYSVLLICGTYTFIFVIIETIADVGFSLRHHVQDIREQNKQLRNDLQQAKLKLNAFSHGMKAEAFLPTTDSVDEPAVIEANQEPELSTTPPEWRGL
jgi:hypothetical protein